MKRILSEEAIISGLKTGKEKAFNALFDDFYDALLYFANKIIVNKEEAEDIALTSFEKFYSLKNNFDSINTIRSFLYNTTRNACVDYLRKKQRQMSREKEFVYVSKPDSTEYIEHIRTETELLRMINYEIERMPKNYRRVFEMYYLENMSTEEIAAALDISTINVRKIKSRAIQQLRLVFKGKDLWLVFLLVKNVFLKN